MTEPSSDDAKVQHWITWLDHGVTLRIPETSIPYCDVHQSTLRTLGGGSYERADEWSAFEAGHGRYGSTDRKTFAAAALRELLRDFARRCPERVRPLNEHETPVIDAAEALSLVREGRRSISPWFAGVDRELHSAIFGADGEAYRVTSKLAKFVAVERLDPASDASLKGLCIAQSALLEPAPVLLARARRHCERRDELLRELASDPRLAIVASQGISPSKAGRHAPGLVFFELNRTLVAQQLDAHELRRNVALALIADEALRCAPLDLPTFDALCAIEDKLDALRASLVRGELAFQRNTSIATWWLWVDGAPRAVTVREGAPVALVEDEDVTIPNSDLSMYVCFRAQPERFHPIDEGVREAVRALIATRPR